MFQHIVTSILIQGMTEDKENVAEVYITNNIVHNVMSKMCSLLTSPSSVHVQICLL